MKSMALDKQMELFDEGGLMQEGGSIDEESGNDVPVGSLKEEVRDDIPAQLSEGEFVMPADVVRFHGLDKMMALRDEAKTGLQRMDDMGQMGNSEEAVIPDGIPFGMDDLELEDEPVEMQVGGFVQPQTGMQYTAPSTFQNYAQTPVQPFQPQQPVYGQGVQGGYQPQFSGTQQPQQAFQAPTFDTLMPKYITYVNSETKAEIQVPVDASGNPLIPIPAGFVPKSSLPTEEEKKPETPTTVTQTSAVQQDTGGDSDPFQSPKILSPEEQRIATVTNTDAFKKVSDILDPRGIMDKVTDTIGGVLGSNTKNKEFDKVKREIAVGVANATTDSAKQAEMLNTIAEQLTGPQLGTKTAEEAAATPVLSGAEADKFLQDKIESARVKTATVTGETDAIAGRIGRSEDVANKVKDLNTRMQDLGLAGNQRKDYLNAIMSGEPREITFAKPGEDYSKTGPATPTNTVKFAGSSGDAATDAIEQQAANYMLEKLEGKPVTYGTDRAEVSKLGISPGESRARFYGSEAFAGKTLPTTTRRDRMADDPAGIADSGPVIDTARDKETAVNVDRYRSQGYSPSAAATAARNKTEADRSAREQTGNPNTSAVTGSDGKAITTTNARGETSVVTSTGPKSSEKGLAIAAARQERNDDNATDSRVICTELYKQGKLSRDLYRMDVVYTARDLPTTIVRGYHYWAIPMVPVIRKNKLVCSIFEYLTIKRAEEIAHIVDPTAYPKSTITGKLIKTVGEAICYGIGKFVKQKDYSVLYNGKSV